MTNTDNGPASTKTPPRHNYANPHTPIASIKRPRSSLERPSSTTMTRQQHHLSTPNSLVHKSGSTRGSSLSPAPRSTQPQMRSGGEEALSPMHPPKAVHRDPNDHVEEDTSWVGRKVDALFSPVLSFLAQQEVVTPDLGGHPVSTPDGAKDAASRTSDSLTNPTASESSSLQSNGGNVSPDEEDEISCGSLQPMEEDHSGDEDEFNPWQFIKSLPDYRLVQHLCPPVTLPPKARDAPPVTLVLDLDETLVHCTVEPVDQADLTFPVVFHGTTYQVHVRLRPHLQTFLRKIRGNFEVIVFTASQKVYANELLDLIDPDGIYIQYRLFRESCLAVEGNFLKDLNVLGRDLTKTVLVDNSPHAFGYQVDNGIPIESWFDDKDDRELLKLAKFLEKLHSVKDVRSVVRERFRCFERIAEAPPM